MASPLGSPLVRPAPPAPTRNRPATGAPAHARGARARRLRLGILLCATLPVALSGGLLGVAGLPAPAVLTPQLSAITGWGLLLGTCGALTAALLAPRWISRSVLETSASLGASVQRLRDLVRRHGEAVREQAQALQRLEQAVAALAAESEAVTTSAQALLLLAPPAMLGDHGLAMQDAARAVEHAHRSRDGALAGISESLAALERRAAEDEAQTRALVQAVEELAAVGAGLAEEWSHP